jgi:hypothetical protein
MLINSTINLSIIYLLLIDSIFEILFNNNFNYILLFLNNLIWILMIYLSLNNKELIRWINIISIILFISFNTNNFLIWYITFEIIILPMLYLISKRF